MDIRLGEGLAQRAEIARAHVSSLTDNIRQNTIVTELPKEDTDSLRTLNSLDFLPEIFCVTMRLSVGNHLEGRLGRESSRGCT